MLKKRIAAVLTCLALAAALLPMSVMAQATIPLVQDVRITGNAVVGQTLTGSYEYWGADTTGVTVTYQWYVTSNNRKRQLSAQYDKIAGATTTEYTLPEDYVDRMIVFEATVKDSTGQHIFRSPAIGTIVKASGTETAAKPSVSYPKPVVAYNYNNSTPYRVFAHYTYIDVNAGESDAEEGSEIQWMRADSLNGEYTDIEGATGRVYELTEEDKKTPHFFKFRVTPKNKAGEKGETVTSWGMGVGDLVSKNQGTIVSNGGIATATSSNQAMNYAVYFGGGYGNYWYKMSDGDYDSAYGYANSKIGNPKKDIGPTNPAILTMNMGSIKKFNTIVVYAGNFNESNLFKSSVYYKVRSGDAFSEIPVVTCKQNADESYTSFISAAKPIEIRVPAMSVQFIGFGTSRSESSFGEIQAYNLNTPENVTVKTDCPDVIKIPVGGSVPEIKVSAVNRNDSTPVQDSDIFVVPPTLPDVSKQEAGQTYQYNITVKDNTGGLTLVQRTVELVDAETQPVEVTAAFGDGETALTAVQKGNNRVTVTAVNDLFVEASIQPVVGLFNGDRLEAVQIGEKAALKAAEKTYTFDFSVEDPAGRSIRVLAWKDLNSMEPMQVINGRLAAPQE